MTIIILFIIVDIGIALTMSPSQTTALSPLLREYYPHGVDILNTLQQLSATIGSSLFIGIMSGNWHITTKGILILKWRVKWKKKYKNILWKLNNMLLDIKVWFY